MDTIYPNDADGDAAALVTALILIGGTAVLALDFTGTVN